MPSLSQNNGGRTDAIVVRKFADRNPAFLQNRRQDVVVMLEALTRGDYETVEFLGHGMRGAGGMFGFQAITDIGVGLEAAGASEDAGTSRRWIDELSAYLDRAEAVVS